MEKKTDTEYVYNKSVVDAAGIKDCFKHSFLYFLKKDYEGKFYGFSDRVLATYCVDMDELETDSPFPQNDNTMDLAIGIGRFDDTERVFSNKRLLPVELKLKCESFRSLHKDRERLIGKDVHTRDLLKEHNVDSKSIFLFTKEVAPEALRYFIQWKRESKVRFGHWKAMDSEQYTEFIGFEEEFPYRTLTNLEDLDNILDSFIDDGDYEGMIDWLYGLKEKAESFLQRYKLPEVKHISTTAAEAIARIMPKVACEKDYIALQLEEFRKIEELSLSNR